ncbi:SPOR domain-containing protein [Ruegeria sp.]|uniref:SPOR domain-containing protein n=1 Tax=Ruegeria sp. TaxID=1879320 RepID=UPI00232770CF|nr:SPOR domain-containing protein [Ruegeria sp.]MDA7963032.1 SPOR domain-containing protein [Ruegeria sp.]
MKQAIGKRFGPYRVVALTALLTALSACEEGFQLASPAVETTEAEENGDVIELFPQANSGNQKDVEAPEVFQVVEAGLWDGRPSLGGIWVAHPDVSQPERVRIKNTANNKTVTGALFRRELSLSGPALQVSSAAAAQLGMLAGAPTRIEVVALRREDIAPPPVEEAPTEEVEETPEETATDVDVAAAAEVPEVETEEKPVKRKWWQKKTTTDTAPNAAGAVAAGAAVTASASEEAEDVVEAATESPAPAALTDPEVTAPTEQPKKRKWWQKKDKNEITETPLDPIAGAAAAIDAAEPAAATTAAVASTTTAALSKPFVQAGTFSVEANANSAAEKIRRNGMTADVRALQSEGKTIWRVLVGPAQTRAERKAILADVKDLGFTDAFTASN